MKYLFSLLVFAAGFTACKKEEPKYCWQCTKTTDVRYLYAGSEVTTKTKEDSTVCGLTEGEIRSFVSSNKLAFQGVYQDSITAHYNTTMDCAQQ